MSSARSSMEEVCVVCHQSLRIQIEESEDEFIYDDVELPCQHHIHYDCARDLHDQSIQPISRCPQCSAALLQAGKLLVTVRNEGGVTEHFDLGQDLEEQKALAAEPGVALNEAFLSFCFAQDYEALEGTLRDGADVDAIQRGTGMTGLHLCALNNDGEGIRLLLRHGASKDIRGMDGSRALDLAFSEGSHEAAYALQ